MNLNGFETTDTQNTSSTTFPKYFSVAEANAALPLVRRVVQDLVEQYRIIMSNHTKLQKSRLPDEQHQQAEAVQAQATDKMNSLVGELSDIGCELKDWECGLVDFPARLEDRDVFLCWKLGEEQVSQWHEIHAGFTGRESITDQFV